MITQKQFIVAFEKELEIIRHLAKKIDPKTLEYRPTPKQRSLLELLNYLGHIFELGVSLNVIGHSKDYMELAKNAPVVTLENFDAVMEKQMKTVRAKIESVSAEAMMEEIEIFGAKDLRAIHMLNVMKWAVAYKMQLFLYIKANGNHDISTSNLWRGVDPAPKQ